MTFQILVKWYCREENISLLQQANVEDEGFGVIGILLCSSCYLYLALQGWDKL